MCTIYFSVLKGECTPSFTDYYKKEENSLSKWTAFNGKNRCELNLLLFNKHIFVITDHQ